MRTALIAATLLAGCSLYTGDDAPADVDAGEVQADAGSVSIAGAYRATLTCLGSECSSPLATMDQATIAVTDTVDVAWARNGDPAPSFRHVGAMAADDCAEIASGADGASSHDAYRLCVNSASPTFALTATVAWGTSTWRVDLARL
jgi:hypothetical protein